MSTSDTKTIFNYYSIGCTELGEAVYSEKNPEEDDRRFNSQWLPSDRGPRCYKQIDGPFQLTPKF